MRIVETVVVAIMLGLGCGGAAMAMDVAAFLVKADALQQKGAMAVFSGDSRVVMGELQAASKSLQAERVAAAAAGRQPAYCPGGKSGLSANEIFAAMRAVPPAQRPQTQVQDALRTAYAKKFPCPASSARLDGGGQ